MADKKEVKAEVDKALDESPKTEGVTREKDRIVVKAEYAAELAAAKAEYERLLSSPPKFND